MPKRNPMTSASGAMAPMTPRSLTRHEIERPNGALIASAATAWDMIVGIVVRFCGRTLTRATETSNLKSSGAVSNSVEYWRHGEGVNTFPALRHFTGRVLSQFLWLE